MSGLITSLPVLLSIAIAALIPFDVFPSPLNEAFHGGGWGMRLILFSALVSLWLSVDRLMMVIRTQLDARGFMQQLEPRLAGGDWAGAVQVCQQTDKPLSRIIGAGLARAEEGEYRVQAAMDEAAYYEVPSIEKRTGYLALMGNVATLMGLFGTIIGLIHSFGAVSQSNAQDNATLLAAGIAEAMNCTAFGLLTGITALLAFSVLNGRTQSILDEINYYTLRAFRAWKRSYQQRGQHEPDFHQHPIHAPHAHLMEKTGLLKKGGGHGKKSTFASLQLTPLIDMFIVLVIFLLISFSASGEIVAANKDIKLPMAEMVEKLKRVPVVQISYPAADPTGGVVTLDTGMGGKEVSTARELIEDDGPDWKIPKLTEQLLVMKNNWKVTNPNKPFLGELIVQADRNVNFKIIKKVMYSAGIAGYGNLLFAVRKAAKKGEAGAGE